MEKKKNAAAVELGRRGGKVRVSKGSVSVLPPEERSLRMKLLAEARWAKVRKAKKGTGKSKKAG